MFYRSLHDLQANNAKIMIARINSQFETINANAQLTSELQITFFKGVPQSIQE
jgi:hypothetical protein